MWIRKLKSPLFSVLFAVFSVFGISLLTTNGNSYADTWTSSNLVSSFSSHVNGTRYSISLNDLGFDNSFSICSYGVKFVFSSSPFSWYSFSQSPSVQLRSSDASSFAFPFFYIYSNGSSSFSSISDVWFDFSGIPSNLIFSYFILQSNAGMTDISNSISNGSLTGLYVRFSDCSSDCSSPSGNLDITENGTYDVTNYASATVNVENEIIQGDYHDDLVSINNSILIVAAVGLVIYFFYAIYKMLLGGRK